MDVTPSDGTDSGPTVSDGGIVADAGPVTADDTRTTAEDTPLTVTAPGVLGNDADPDGDGLTATKLTEPLHGSVTVSANGAFTSTPARDYTGSDQSPIGRQTGRSPPTRRSG